MKKTHILLLFIAFLCPEMHSENIRQRVDLEGQWQFALDTANVGILQSWYLSNLKGTINLPGTTDLSQKGFLNKDSTTMHLSRLYKYEGVAWYRKRVVIPSSYRAKRIQLFLERTKSSTVWIDGTLVGGSKLLQSPQQFDATSYLTPGEHFITIRIDNNLKLTPYGSVHIYSDDTQTNWNGIIGKLFVEASSKTRITNLQVYPDIDKKKIEIKLEIDNPQRFADVNIELLVERTSHGKTEKLQSQKMTKAVEPVIQLEYILDDECRLWDEYQQSTYRLTAVISKGTHKDSQTVPFGMRKFSAKGTQFDINGRTTFLRGKHDGAIFPLTGCVPMDVEGWARVYRIAKSYGINHYRFHSYCPPEAAFTAADREGIYVQAELPFWGGLDSDSVAGMLKAEGMAMLKSYANHPSFVMFSAGNEIWSGLDRVEKNVTAFKEYDSRPLYAMGSNNGIGFVAPRPCSDFFVGARTPSNGDTTLTHTRLTHAFADSKSGGILNTQTPSANIAFNYAVSHLNIPIVSHEIGQYQVFPDYNEIDKYTGVLRARNLEIFRNRLKKAGMFDQDIAFQKASGAWSALCYKAEMEAAIRTQGMGGFHLLDLQDYPGQGTALVGILDAFMDSKNVVSRENWLQSCNDVVLLLEFSKYCWTNKEQFHAKAEVANYSNQPIPKNVIWEIKSQDGAVIQRGMLTNKTIENGKINSVGEINMDLSSIKKAEKLTVNISIPNSSYSNTYPVWVYPQTTTVSDINGIVVASKPDKDVFDKLQKGAKVLLFPSAEDVLDKSVGGLFPPEFWNYGMFKGISEWAKKPVSPGTLGLLTNPKHPLFNSFPTDFHTNWQWFSIIKASNPLVLDSTSSQYRPIVQVVDNLERNHKLGLVFEFKVGSGKLLVCMSQLNKIMDKPEAVSFYQSIVNYMNSSNFNPDYEVSQEELNALLTKE